MKTVLVMDNASYHHELNHEYFPKGKTPPNAPKGLCNDILHKAGCGPSRSCGYPLHQHDILVMQLRSH